MPESIRPDLARDYYELQNIEEIATAIMSEALFGACHRRLTIFLPSIVLSPEIRKIPKPENPGTGECVPWFPPKP